MKYKKNLNLFSRRHIGQTEDEIAYMLQTLGFSSMKSFIDAVIPSNILDRKKINIGKENDEENALKKLRKIW